MHPRKRRPTGPAFVRTLVAVYVRTHKQMRMQVSYVGSRRGNGRSRHELRAAAFAHRPASRQRLSLTRRISQPTGMKTKACR
jgi:hypothetical protein